MWYCLNNGYVDDIDGLNFLHTEKYPKKISWNEPGDVSHGGDKTKIRTDQIDRSLFYSVPLFSFSTYALILWISCGMLML